MTSAPIPSVTLEGDQARLYEIIPADGSRISNQRAQEALEWPDDRYWAARDALVDAKLVMRASGRGGTLRRVIAVPESESVSVPIDLPTDERASVAEEMVHREEGLYEPMAKVVRGDWAKDRRTTPLGVEVTARQGRRATGGTWSRPDIVSVEIKTYQYVPGKFLEVVTFEVKPYDAIDVQAVYEALAHRRAATHAYVLLHDRARQDAAVEEAIKSVCLVARSHGIGVVTATDAEDYNTWEELEEAQRVEPDPDRLDQFIETQLSEPLKRKIARALR